MKIVFMGTPLFAVPSLERLASHTEVAAVFCQPDRPRGRSGKPVPPPVKETSLRLGIPVHQPKRIRARRWLQVLRELGPDLIVVAAFGQILPQTLLDIPSLDCINVHASLLPRWRGASPIHFAIRTGDAETGISIMKVIKALDAGPVYSRRRLPIEPGVGRVALEAALADLGADLLLETLPRLKKTTPEPQDDSQATYAPIIRKEMGYCDFTNQSAQEIERMVRAFEGWPGVPCRFRDNPLKLIRVKTAPLSHQAAPGAIVEITRKRLVVACASGTTLEILELQPAGKKSQLVAAFINGYQPHAGEIFQNMGLRDL